jgi:hypothetical protein
MHLRIQIRGVVLGLVLSLSFAGIAIAADREPNAPNGWQYVAESGEPGFDLLQLQKLACFDERPENVIEMVTYHGTKRRFAQLRYGSPNSNRVTIVIDEREGGEFDLYVDRNRNRTIESKDLVDGNGPWRTTALAVEILKDEIAEHVPRRIRIRRNAIDGGLSFATTGYLQGHVELGGRMIAVRRVDGDGNGFFADHRDRLWLDLDGDGKWDPFSEQFPLLPVMKLQDRRYALRSDAIGSRLSLEEITGVGTVRLALPTLRAGTEVADLEVTLMGDDGSAYAMRGVEEAVQVPIGKYAVTALSLSLRRTGESLPWNFVFSRSDPPADGHWHVVRRDTEVAVDPIGTLRFTLEFPNGEGSFPTGKTISVAPRLYTHEGLLINSCSIGKTDGRANYGSGPAADVRLLSAKAVTLETHQSGFA